MSKEYQPIYVLPEGSKQDYGKTAQKNNIKAAKLVAETIRTTLGPKGMDKLLVNSMNEITITNDGVTILDEMEIQHPIAKMIVDIARTQENEVGDGTTTAVILAGELLSKAEELINRNIHPTIITKGYRIASQKASEILEEIAKPIEKKDKEVLINIVKTAMTGKGAEVVKEVLADIVVKAVLESESKEHISVEKKVGYSIEKSEVISGIILDKEKVHPDMPSEVKEGKIALINCPLEIRDTETDAKISITNPQQMQEFLAQEEMIIKQLVEKIIKSGANAIFCQKGIDDLAQYFLSKAGIFAVRRMKQSDMKKIAKATGAKIVYDIKDLDAEKLGSADICEKKERNESLIHITKTKNNNFSTILVTGNTNHVADEAKRAVEDAIGDLFSLIKNSKAVPGAGAIEIEIEKKLIEFSKSLSGREQLAVKAFAESLEIVPKTLAENAGLDPIDVITELNSAHEKNADYGIDVFSGKHIDSWKEGVIEPIAVKLQAIQSATEVANMILRIDDVIATSPDMENPNEQNPNQPNVRFPNNMEY